MMGTCGDTASISERVKSMHSQAYLEARKEFINCLCMSIFGIGVPIVIAFREGWPIMKAEKQKEQ